MRKSFAEWFLEEGSRAVSQAASRVLEDPRGQEAVARAVGLAQRGLQAFGTVQERALHAAGFAARPDYEELRKQLARIRRKIRDLDRRSGAGADRGENR